MRIDPGWMVQFARVGEPGRPTEAARRWIRAFVAPLVRAVHRPVLSGTERLPDGPFLLVANHSAIGTSEVFALIVRWMEAFGDDRPLTAMAHPFAFVLWPLTWFMRHMGAVPATYEAAESALASGVSVLVFPGGDWEASRPFWQAKQVQFQGRKGFLRIAKKAGVPVVPLGISGSIYSAPMVLRSRVLSWVLILPRLLGLRVYPVSVLGILGAIAIAAVAQPLGVALVALLVWVWLAIPLSMLPWLPVSIRLEIGEPIPHEAMFGDDVPEDAQLSAAYDRVVGSVAGLIDR